VQKASNKIVALIIGVIATLVIFGAIVLIMTRPGQTNNGETNQNGIITATDLKSVKDKTAELKNFGDLPVVVTQDEVGRSNPFESY